MIRFAESPWAPILLLALGLGLRIYAAGTIAPIYDERQLLSYLAEEGRPMGWTGPDEMDLKGRTLDIRVARAGTALFGDGRVGSRLAFLLLAVLGLFVFYKAVEEAWGRQRAAVALGFMVFSQYHIGVSRLMLDISLELLVVPLSMYGVLRALRTGEGKWLIAAGIALGVGGTANEAVVLLMLPAFALALALDPRRRGLLLGRECALALVIVALSMVPHLVWNIRNGFHGYASEHVLEFGLSLRSAHLYFGEILGWLAERTEFIVWAEEQPQGLHRVGTAWRFFIGHVSGEFPVVHWISALLIFASFLYCLRAPIRSDPVVRFCAAVFAFILAVTTVVAGGYRMFDDHWWAQASIFPGAMILARASHDALERFRFARGPGALLLAYLAWRAVWFSGLDTDDFAFPRSLACADYLEDAAVEAPPGGFGVASRQCGHLAGYCGDTDAYREAKARGWCPGS